MWPNYLLQHHFSVHDLGLDVTQEMKTLICLVNLIFPRGSLKVLYTLDVFPLDGDGVGHLVRAGHLMDRLKQHRIIYCWSLFKSIYISKMIITVQKSFN